MKPKLILAELPDSKSNRRVNKILAEIRSRKPTEVVIWYKNDQECGVRTSVVGDRTAVVGALTAAAMDIWNS